MRTACVTAQCRKMVLELVHSIPIASHLGKHNNADECYKGSNGQPFGRMWQTTVGGNRGIL